MHLRLKIYSMSVIDCLEILFANLYLNQYNYNTVYNYNYNEQNNATLDIRGQKSDAWWWWWSGLKNSGLFAI